MCDSKALGGRRCAAHTRPIYLEALNSLLSYTGANYPSSGEPYAQEIPAKVLADFVTASIDHASTPTGSIEIDEDIVKYAANHEFEAVSEVLKIAKERGAEIREDAQNRKEEVSKLVRLSKPNEGDTATGMQNAFEAIDIAIALGAEIPAPAGSRTWVILGDNDAGGYQILSHYSTKEAAEQALSDFLYKEFLSFRYAPWGCYNDVKDPVRWKEMALAYESSHSLADAMNWYKNTGGPTKDMFQQLSEVLIDYYDIAKPDELGWKENPEVIKPRPITMIDMETRKVTVIDD